MSGFASRYWLLPDAAMYVNCGNNRQVEEPERLRWLFVYAASLTAITRSRAAHQPGASDPYPAGTGSACAPNSRSQMDVMIVAYRQQLAVCEIFVRQVSIFLQTGLSTGMRGGDRRTACRPHGSYCTSPRLFVFYTYVRNLPSIIRLYQTDPD